jgi:tRNA (guanosine-2'-O-)-methyltransferase
MEESRVIDSLLEVEDIKSPDVIRDRELSYARGYFGIGIYQGKTSANLGTLWRSADVFSAHFIFTIGRKYKRQSSDTTKAFRKIPLYNYVDFETFYANMPYDCPLVGVEIARAVRVCCHLFIRSVVSIY